MKILKTVKATIRNILIKVRFLLVYTGRDLYCPVCGKSSKRFGFYGIPARKNAKCMYCGSLERDRLSWLYLSKCTNLRDNHELKLLHIAPEKMFSTLFKKQLSNNYVSADIDPSKAMIEMDITNIQYPADSFDAIYCSHVLEHVSDDMKAMKEFYRVLKQEGWAILLVPLTDDPHTKEDQSITDPNDRAKLYGQEDHLRLYGLDYTERLKNAGFKVQVSTPSDFLTHDEIGLMGISNAAGTIHYCTKYDHPYDSIHQNK